MEKKKNPPQFRSEAKNQNKTKPKNKNQKGTYLFSVPFNWQQYGTNSTDLFFVPYCWQLLSINMCILALIFPFKV